MKRVNIYKFNTWMNMFAAQKHYYYCDLGNIYLHLDIQGKYRLQVTGSNRNFAFERLDDILLDTDCENNVCLKIDNAEKYEGLFFTIIEDQNRPITFKSGAWCSDKAPRRQNKLAVVTCTFRREDYINKNIAKFEKFLRDNPQLKDKNKALCFRQRQNPSRRVKFGKRHDLPEHECRRRRRLYPRPD